MSVKLRIFILGATLVFLFPSLSGSAGDLRSPVVEPVTGILFPSEVRFSQDAEDYTLQLTGTAARTKWFFRVYAIAHYAQTLPGAGAFGPQNVLTDGSAKQITIQYARNVPAQKITRILREDFELNTTPSEYREIATDVERMLAYFVHPVKKGDVFVMRWLSGGRVYLELNGQKLGEAKNGLFARTLWAIWLGEHSVVDPKALMAQATREAGA